MDNTNTQNMKQTFDITITWFIAADDSNMQGLHLNCSKRGIIFF